MKYWSVNSVDKVAIVGGGLSLKEVDLSSLRGQCFVIGINDVWRHVPWIDAVFSIDTKNLPDRFVDCNIPIYQAVPDGYGKTGRSCDSKAIIVPWMRYLRRLNDGVFALDSDSVCSTSSSMLSALNFAFHLQPEKIALFGMDLKGYGRHWYTNRKVNLNGSFPVDKINQQAKEQKYFLDRLCITVMNASVESLVESFPKCTPQEGIEWLLR